MKTLLPIFVVLVLILGGISVTGISSDRNIKSITIEKTVSVSEPVLRDRNQYIIIDFPEATSKFNVPGYPELPYHNE
ncbi:MAG: hypothetical protein DRN05_02185, partial [Thermoplasmata archaeon]